ncbi:hypothetical protein GIB67_041362 [Kingdonia uniflora]|uniref:DDE Tnp4 domain-containing protein n=1 Tax=Kingdonia uniflora TaxID=39325 RepID=A0A7J7NIV8_9MAGN|nr:hypothetical protein GIB67_041362 [Kingdonia uniflora]
MDDYDLELDELELVAAATGYYCYSKNSKQISRKRSHSKSEFLNDLLDGDDDQFCEMFRMDKHVFYKFCEILRQKDLLHDTSGMKIEEQVAIFLNVIGHNERTRVIQERYQHSGETISRHFNNVLKAIKSLSRELLQPPDHTTPSHIFGNARFDPYFKDCIGAIDGMHIPAHVPAKDQSRFRNRKGVLSQSALVACTFDLQFIFVYPGWEGSAADSHVLRTVLDDPDQNFPQVPEGKYYLVDGEYSNIEGFISPFPGVRYHLHEFKGANRQPRSAQELFNHRHASLRDVIQRCCDCLKARFPILQLAPPYAFPTQRDLILAACVIHNHIRREERNDWLFNIFEKKGLEEEDDMEDESDTQSTSLMQDQSAFLLRNSIASTMWSNFMNEWDTW